MPDDAMTVGDTRFDIEAAAKAGLKTIGFICGGTTEGVLREAGAVAIYRDPADCFSLRFAALTAFRSDQRVTVKRLIPEPLHSRI